MAAKTCGTLPDKRPTRNEAFEAGALAGSAVGHKPKLLYRWQQAQVSCRSSLCGNGPDPEVCQLRTQLKRAEQELAILK